ncbi:MAG: YraN family protein [Firmicutes bacterium]|nr:YraN family protein [Bacillota bacterium]
MTFFRQATGQMGEDAAAKKIKQMGMRIKCRNYRCLLGEIDIIAEDKDTLVFVEVRSRRTKGYGLPQETIGYKKMEKVRKVAQQYMLAKKLLDVNCRFDVAAVIVDDQGKPKQIDYIKDAF